MDGSLSPRSGLRVGTTCPREITVRNHVLQFVLSTVASILVRCQECYPWQPVHISKHFNWVKARNAKLKFDEVMICEFSNSEIPKCDTVDRFGIIGHEYTGKTE